MEYKIVSILGYLKDHGVGASINISPIIISLYSKVNKTDSNSLNTGWNELVKLLADMKENKLIDYSPAMETIINNRITRSRWADETIIVVSITGKGVDKYEEEMRLKNEKSLQDSMIEMNQINKRVLSSTLNLNENVIPNFNKVQRTLTIVTILIAFLSLIAIAVSAYFSSKSPTSVDIQKLDSTLNKNAKLLDSLLHHK
jgi:hypothetical protein